VFHRVDDMESMPARRFLAFVARLPHYDGAIRHAAADDQAIATSVDLMAIHPVWGSVGAYSKAPAV